MAGHHRRWAAALGLGAPLTLLVSLLALARVQAAPLADPTPNIPIPVCDQHPQVCPVDEATWAGAPGAWQTTGRTWRRHSATANTAPGHTVIWQWSEPYNGVNPAYLGYRQNPYANFSANPGGRPNGPGPAPEIYDWERWDEDGANWRLFQYGINDTSAANYVGLTDCASGLNYPVVDSDHPFAYTPLSVTRAGECRPGGYLATMLVEEWGAPRSEARRLHCDNPLNGVTLSESAFANQVCNVSPHIGVIYQLYLFQAGPAPEDFPVAGCEGVVTAWGWPKPAGPAAGGQDWEAWFRNGELRWTYWLFASNHETPAADDSAWWLSHCSSIWTELTNWVYDGRYLIGDTVYTDTRTLPTTFAALAPSAGAVLTSPLDGLVITIPAGAFSETVRLTQTLRLAQTLPPTGDRGAANIWFGLTAAYSSTGALAVPALSLTLTLNYTTPGAGGLIEPSLGLYRRAGDAWVSEPSALNLAANTLTATVAALGDWALLGDTHRLFLPQVAR